MDRFKDIRAIAFDADDTLWALQNYFEDVEHEYCELLAEYGKEKDISAALFETESKNMADLGYGCKAFTISLVENAVPGILVVASHIVVGVVTCNDHQGTQDDLGVTGGLDSFDDVLAGSLLRLALDGADEDILVAQSVHLSLHLAVAHLCGVRGAVAHEDEGGAVRSSGVQTVETGGLDGLSGDGLGDSLLVGVDDGGIAAHLAQQRLGDGDGLELVAVAVHHLHHLVVLSAMHQTVG